MAEVMLTWGLTEGRRHAQKRGTQVRPQSNVRGILWGQQWRMRYVSVHKKTKQKKKTPSLTNCYCFYTVYCKSFTACFYNPFYFILQDTFFIDRIFTKKNFMYKILA